DIGRQHLVGRRSRQPAAGSRQPAAGSQQPAASSRQAVRVCPFCRPASRAGFAFDLILGLAVGNVPTQPGQHNGTF
ncbi:hypothetical protein ACFU7X_46790, partial [Streptomyces chartreusis]|uniref:hypothetical protein n=1 Tax=Streptomyces chartreusis TaxID=1969 RepID=UPI0036C42A06